jgi:hypothetical protein
MWINRNKEQTTVSSRFGTRQKRPQVRPEFSYIVAFNKQREPTPVRGAVVETGAQGTAVAFFFGVQLIQINRYRCNYVSNHKPCTDSLNLENIHSDFLVTGEAKLL